MKGLQKPTGAAAEKAFKTAASFLAGWDIQTSIIQAEILMHKYMRIIQ